MSVSPEFCAHLIDLLSGFGAVSVRRMFGGAGLYRDDVMFALIADDTLYMKSDDELRPAFESAGSRPFSYDGRCGTVIMSYYEAPADVMEDAEALCAWAGRSFDAALRTRKPKTKKKAKARRC